MIFVLDASALMAFLDNEPGADVVEGLLLAPDNTCFAHAINRCETVSDHPVAPIEEVRCRNALEHLLRAGYQVEFVEDLLRTKQRVEDLGLAVDSENV